MLEVVKGCTAAELLQSDDLAAVSQRPGGFKFSYAFGVGLTILMRKVGDTPNTATINRWCEALNLKSANSLERDYVYEH